jgi:DNA-binding IclR family transcriptional regulator
LRVGAELDVLVSASGRALLAFQDPETIALRVKESVQRRPEHASLDIMPILDKIRKRGFESIVSLQIKGLHAVGCPILDTQNRAIAALTVPYAERLDQSNKKTVSDVETVLGKAARALSERMGWRHGETPRMRDEVGEATTVSGQTQARRVNRR